MTSRNNFKNKTQKNSDDKRCEFSHFYKVKLDVLYAIQHIFSKVILSDRERK